MENRYTAHRHHPDLQLLHWPAKSYNLEAVRRPIVQISVNDALWYPDGRCHSSAMINKLCVTFQHILPAYILDTLARLKGTRPIMVRVQTKLSKAAKCLEYFSTKQWNFRDDNVRRLGEQLSPEDRETFMFDVRQIDWPSYLEHYILGIRQFILKESPDTLPAARSHITK